MIEYLKARAWLTASLLSLWAILAPIHTIIYAVSFLILADAGTGIWKAVKTKEPVTSRRMRDTVAKMAAYFIALLVGFAIDQVVGDSMLLARVAAGSICLIEATSVNENLKAATGIDVLSAVIEKLKPKPKEPSA